MRLYRNTVEPVLELCTDPLEGYTGNAHYSVRVFETADFICISNDKMILADVSSTCRGFYRKVGMNKGGNTKH